MSTRQKSREELFEQTRTVLRQFQTELTPQEIDALSHLLIRGKLTANQLNSLMHIDITRAYTVLDNLVNKEFARKSERGSPKSYLPLHPHYIFSKFEKKLDNLKSDIAEIGPLCEQLYEASQGMEEPSLSDFLYTCDGMPAIVSDLAPILKSATEVIICGSDLQWLVDQTFLLERLAKLPVRLYTSSKLNHDFKSLSKKQVFVVKAKLPHLLLIKTADQLHVVFLVDRLNLDGTHRTYGVRLLDSGLAGYFSEALPQLGGT